MTHLFSGKKSHHIIGSSDIRVIGPRASGKTAFIAALARYPNAKIDSPVISVDPHDDDSRKLIIMAQDILEKGSAFAPTPFAEDMNLLPKYTLAIELKPKFAISKNTKLEITCREYSGEIIKDLRGGSSGINLSNYLDDCANNTLGLLLLIDATSHQQEAEYAQAFEKLEIELNERLVGANKPLQNYRIAVVFSKTEQGEAWVFRHDLQQFINLRFFKTHKVLQKWAKKWGCSINYFFCSAFGTRGKPARPNFKMRSRDEGGTYGVIANPAVWRPFGLVAPIYWLYTGKDDQRLREIEE
ncbi:MAG: hypothetical protein HC836_49730 [Richelia sp. RM2_1_2]|nr:hypothetical protein [Richelia sp. RM2_1_2]